MIEQLFKRWGVGSVRSLHPDDLPETGVARAVNTALLPTTGGDSQVTMRPGHRQYAVASPIASTAFLTGLTQYVYGTSTLTPYVIGVTSTQQVWVMTSPTATTAVGGTGVGLHASNLYQFAAAKGRLYACAAGSTSVTIFRLAASSTHYYYQTGMAAPANAPTSDSTTSGSMTGSYEFAVTWYNENLVNESSRSGILTASLSTASITVGRNNTTPPDGATHWRVYVRKATISSKFQRSTAMTTSIAYTTLPIDVSDTDINAMTLQAPSTTENNRPPDGLIALAWHQGRMFATDGTDLFYSNLDNPEAWDPANVEYVAAGDGQRISALLSLDELNLAIFKTDSIYLLAGDSPQTWEIRKMPGSVGAGGVPGNNVAYGDGLVAFFGRHGIYLWDRANPPTDITNEVWREVVAQVNPTITQGSGQVYFDPQGHRFLFFPHLASTLTGFAAAEAIALPFSTIHRCWEATWWTGPGRSSMDWGRCGGVAQYSQKQDARLMLSGAGCRALELSSDVWTDAAGNETGLNLTFTVASATTAALVCAHTGAIPASSLGSVLTVIDTTTAEVHRSAYTQATNATSVTFTLTTAMSTSATAGSVVVLDIPVMELETKSVGGEVEAEKPGFSASQLMRKKRFGRVYMDVAASGDCKVVLGVLRDAETTASRCWATTVEQNYVRDLLPTQPSSISGSERGGRYRAGFTAWRARLRFLGWFPGVKWGLRLLGVQIQGAR